MKNLNKLVFRLKFFCLLITLIYGCGGSGESTETVSPVVTYQVTSLVNSGAGTISPASTTVRVGESREFTINESEGYQIAGVTGCNGVLTDNVYRIANVSASCTITANFLEIPKIFTISALSAPGGTIVPSRLDVVSGANTEFVINVFSGYKLNSIEGCDGELVANRYIVKSVRNHCTISTAFTDLRKAPYQLNYSLDDDNMDIEWSGDATLGYIVYYSSQSFNDTKPNIVVLNTVKTNSKTTVIPLLKSYNHIFVRVASQYENIELLSSEILEVKHNFRPSGSLNDTGTKDCLNDKLQFTNCAAIPTTRQDGNTGRDASAIAGKLFKIGSGFAGFDFSKIDKTGLMLKSQQLAWKTGGDESEGSQWSCVRDNVTGLIWEVKTEQGIRNTAQVYTWYHSSLSINGGNVGQLTFEGCTQDICNIVDYIKHLNQIQLCGSTKWRMPTRAEQLNLIINSGTAPKLDASFFPDQIPDSTYWTQNSYATDVANAWAITSNTGIAIWYPKSKPLQVRLVHSE